MKTKLFHLLVLIFLSMFFKVSAQLAVVDGVNFKQSLINYAEHCLTSGNTGDNLDETIKIFEQGKAYYDALKSVHRLIKNGHKVSESVGYSVRIINEYSKTVRRITSDPYFTSFQLKVFNEQQSCIMKSVANTIGDLNNIINPTGMSLSDKERMDAVDTYHKRVVGLYQKSRMLNLQMEGEKKVLERRKRERLQERNLLR